MAELPAIMSNKTMFSDPIYGQIELHPLLVAIINTPEFERLRHIKQLGVSCYVYPAASHSRFEHSIGVCYLAGKLIRRLRKNQPHLNIETIDILAVEIAGLCHDLGHGPFSHLFERISKPKHELVSKWRLKDVFDSQKVKEILGKYELQEDEEKALVKKACDLIKRDKTGVTPNDKEKEFLYEIVDSPNDIDVDKWDYFTRDCHYLGLKHGFDMWRLLKTARVISGHIAYRDKVVHDIKEMFHTRTVLHEKAYQHKTVVAVEMMIADAFNCAENGGFEFSYVGPKETTDSNMPTQQNDVHTDGVESAASHAQRKIKLSCKLTEAVTIPAAFLELTDDAVVGQIKCHSALATADNELKKAEDLLTRIMGERDLYHLVYEFKADTSSEHTRDEVKKWVNTNYPIENEEEELVEVISIEDKFKPTRIQIYTKDSTVQSEPLESSAINSTKFIVRAYLKCRKTNPNFEGKKTALQQRLNINRSEFEKCFSTVKCCPAN